jgi:hypothetical protein
MMVGMRQTGLRGAPPPCKPLTPYKPLIGQCNKGRQGISYGMITRRETPEHHRDQNWITEVSLGGLSPMVLYVLASHPNKHTYHLLCILTVYPATKQGIHTSHDPIPEPPSPPSPPDHDPSPLHPAIN